MVCSTGSLMQAKRARTTSSQNPVCQVYGCNKDLKSSKDYYKRHKVCDVHSKTAQVIVNGIVQRFCQQCSRFHLLSEFDDGKRSCRKRLAGHNERRRKPQLDILYGKSQKLLQFYRGAQFLRSSLPNRESFICPNILPDSERCSQWSHIKSELEQTCDPQSASPITSDLSSPMPFLHLHGMGGKHLSGTFSFDSTCPLLGTKFTVQESSGYSNSSGALSLLSDQFSDLSSQSTEILMANSRSVQGTTRVHPSVDQNFPKTLCMSIVDKFAPNGLYPSGMNSVEVARAGPACLADSGMAVDYKFQK